MKRSEIKEIIDLLEEVKKGSCSPEQAATAILDDMRKWIDNAPIEGTIIEVIVDKRVGIPAKDKAIIVDKAYKIAKALRTLLKENK